MNTQRVLLLILFASLALYIYKSRQFDSSIQKDADQTQQLIETYISNVEVRQFNDSGNIKYRVKSDYAEQYTDSPIITLSAPDIQAKTDQYTWLLSANDGLYNRSNNIFHVTGDVIIERKDAFVMMKTQSLDYNLDAESIYTDSPVEIVSKTGNIQAVGMTIDLNKETLELHQEIETQYDPKTP